MTFFLILFFLFLILGGYLASVAALLSYVRERWFNWSWSGRLVAALVAPLLILSPYLCVKGLELRHVLARVPDPMHAIWIEYRLEKSWGMPLGMPGDNETGFVVYRLTGGSADWARRKGARLADHLPGGSDEWRPTPIVEADHASSRWHSSQEPSPADHPLNFEDYLGEQSRLDEANRVISEPGSFYSYGRGGSITIVDPRRGKVYFAYAG